MDSNCDQLGTVIWGWGRMRWKRVATVTIFASLEWNRERYMQSSVRTAGRRISSRNALASSIAELPVAIFIMFLILLMPLIDLATIAFRTSFIHSACHNAVHSAARAKTFKENGDKGELSSINIAKRDALATKENGLAGVDFADKDITITIIGTPTKTTKSPIRTDSPLTSVEQKDYLYQIEVQVSGTVEPLVTLSSDFFGKVPGLTVPFPVTATYRQFSEHPAGLAK